jgi:hypothetical protein
MVGEYYTEKSNGEEGAVALVFQSSAAWATQLPSRLRVPDEVKKENGWPIIVSDVKAIR